MLLGKIEARVYFDARFGEGLTVEAEVQDLGQIHQVREHIPVSMAAAPLDIIWERIGAMLKETIRKFQQQQSRTI